MDKVLLIDDDLGLGDLLNQYLYPEGFHLEIANDGETGLAMSSACAYDLIILDVMLPQKNGFEVLRQLRANQSTPVLMLTARCDEVDRIVGLEMGADDYLAKPFNPRELLARMRAVLRRTTQEEARPGVTPEPRRLAIGDLEIDLGARLVLRGGQRVELTAVEFALLVTLVRQAGQVVSREDLIRSVLGRSLSPFDRSIDVHVSKLRKKLGRMTAGLERIKTIRGSGYLYTRAPAGDAPHPRQA